MARRRRYGSPIKAFLGRLILRIARYRLVSGPPPGADVAVIVAAPHTSNWDFFLMLGMAWSAGISPRWLGKKELFVGPLGPLLRALGGISVDRDDPSGVVESLVAEARGHHRLAIVVPAEGTRSRGDHWKSGFRRIAEDADIPYVLAYLDGPSRTGGFGPALRPTADVRADMDLIREFYADKRGLKPANRTEPRLRSEES